MNSSAHSKLLLDKLHPVIFKPAEDADSADIKPSSYILISNFSPTMKRKSKAVAHLSPRKKAPVAFKPKSMAEAVAAYTGKKYSSKSERKLKKKQAKDERKRELISEDEEESLHMPQINDNNNYNEEDFGEEIKVETPISTDSSSDESIYESAVDEVESDSDSTSAAKRTRSQSRKLVDSQNAGDEDEVEDEVDEDYEGEESDEEEDGEEEEEEEVDEEDEEDEEEEDEDEDEEKEDVAEEVEEENADETEEDGKEQRLKLSNTSMEDSEDDSDNKKINEKIELKKLASKDLKNLNKELLEELDIKQISVSSVTSTHSNNNDSGISSPNNENSEFLYGQNLDYSDSDFYQLGEDINDHGSNGSSRIFKNWNKEYLSKAPLGLLNMGVTCYTNTAVQSMIHIPAIQNYLTDIRKTNKYQNIINPRSVTKTMADLSGKMWGSKKNIKYINPRKLTDRLDDINCMMSIYQQEDSHEYFMSLLSKLQEDSTPKKQKLNTSIIYDIFGGVLNQAVVCKNCNYVSKTKQEFYDLSLSLDPKKKRQIVPNSSRSNSKEASPDSNNNEKDEIIKKTPSPRYSVINAISDFFEPELIKKDGSRNRGYDCSNCKKTSDALKFSSIDRAPETLVVHIKRFRFNENSNSSSKLKSSVSYPLILDLSNFDHPELSSYDETIINDDKNPIRYQLISVVVHEGRSISSGHYIAHCRQPSGNWMTYDDEYVNSISEAQVLKEPNAYYLIYTRLKYKGNKRNIEELNGGSTSTRRSKRHRKK